MKLTNNISWEEMTDTSHTSLLAQNRKEAEEYRDNIQRVANQLQIIRDYYGKAININSGFRGPALNKAVGSKAKASQHLTGRAADFTVSGHSVDDVFNDIKSGRIKLTDGSKLIIEKFGGAEWLHFGVDFKPSLSIQFLATNDGNSYKAV